MIIWACDARDARIASILGRRAQSAAEGSYGNQIGKSKEKQENDIRCMPAICLILLICLCRRQHAVTGNGSPTNFCGRR